MESVAFFRKDHGYWLFTQSCIMISDQLHEQLHSHLIISFRWWTMPNERRNERKEERNNQVGKRIYAISCDTNYSLIQWWMANLYTIRFSSSVWKNKFYIQTNTQEEEEENAKRRESERKKSSSSRNDEQNVRKENIMMFSWVSWSSFGWSLHLLFITSKGKMKESKRKRLRTSLKSNEMETGSGVTKITCMEWCKGKDQCRNNWNFFFFCHSLLWIQWISTWNDWQMIFLPFFCRVYMWWELGKFHLNTWNSCAYYRNKIVDVFNIWQRCSFFNMPSWTSRSSGNAGGGNDDDDDDVVSVVVVVVIAQLLSLAIIRPLIRVTGKKEINV